MDILQYASPIKDVVTAIAIIVGGGWAFFRFVINRESASNLYMSWSYETHYFSESVSTIFVTIHLENRGKSKISAKPKELSGAQALPAYTDHNDKLKYACGLQFRELMHTQAIGHISWYRLPDIEGVHEINVLEEFETLDIGTIDFHLEPGEVVEITVPVNLKKGHYVSKLHFVGSNGRMEYWSKLFWLRANGKN